MPTATSTLIQTVNPSITLKGSIPLKPSSSPPPISIPSATSATLHTLYNRAARAFLLRDIPLTHSLIESAFAVIQPPSVVPDHLLDQRRKWDILRITLDTTVYSSPPPAFNEALPDSLQKNLTESPHSLLTSIYARSLALFTPDNGVLPSTKADAAHLPSQVVITLVYSSLKIDCPDVGRVIIEDWLSRRDVHSPILATDAKEDGYEKILELYCLQILPKLNQWEYAQEFLEYEGELSVLSREKLKESLKVIHNEAASLLQRQKPTPTSLPLYPTPSASSRPYSPTPSSSSSSSSISTTSTHTVVPSTHRTPRSISTLTPLVQASISTASLSSDSTATPRQSSSQPTLKSRTANSSSTSYSSTHTPRSHSQSAALRPANLNAYELIKASISPYLTTSNLSTFFLLFVVFPFVSLVLRARRRRRSLLTGGVTGVHKNTELARKRLQAVSANEAGIFWKAWGEVIRAVSDTVRMAGSGLV